MRILWHSNWTRGPTGYGKQTRLVASLLKQMGHEVIVSATFGIGGVVEIDGILHVPGMMGSVKDTRLLQMHIRHLEPDLVVSLVDVWPLSKHFGDAIREAGSRWVPWVPVDHDPCPPAVVSRLGQADRVVAMSQFGKRSLEDAGIKAELIPHGVDLDVFRPGDWAQARAELGLPDDVFLVALVQANKGYPSRKCFQQQFEGFARFRKRHPRSALYLHAVEGMEHGGPNLASLARAVGIREAVICLDQYQALMGVPDEALARVYQAADVTLNATAGEGFGVPIIESLACGTPVIVTDYTAMSELCPERVGWRVGWTDRFFTAIESWQVWPDPRQIDEALEAAYEADLEAMIPDCVEFARQFDARRVGKMWAELADDMVRSGKQQEPSSWSLVEGPDEPELLHFNSTELVAAAKQPGQTLACGGLRFEKKDVTYTVSSRPVEFDAQKPAVVITVKDHLPLIRRTLENLAEHRIIQAANVIVVDDRSEDPRVLTDLCSGRGVSCLRVDNRRGFNFSMLNNIAAHHAAARGIRELVLWNSDLFAPDAETFPRLLEGHRQGDHTITGTRLLYPPSSTSVLETPTWYVRHHAPDRASSYRGTVQFGGAAFRHHALSRLHETYLPVHACRFLPADDPRAAADRPELFVTGAFSIIDLAWFTSVGGFNPSMARSLQDVDLCLRAVEAGRKVMYLGKELFLFHEETVTLQPEREDDPQLASDQLLYVALWSRERLEQIGVTAFSDGASDGETAAAEIAESLQ